MSKYADWRIEELKSELRKRGAKVSGKKCQLVERLEAYDRNADFGQEVPKDSFNMDIPEDLLFRDINSDTSVPEITEEKIKIFLLLFGQDLTKGKALYYGKFLRSIRAAKGADNTFYITGRVSAEMSKKCIHQVDIKVDEYGVVQESQCECAVGMGPEAHCKHIAAVLYALTHVKKGIITKETCTQQLQTFHQTKKYNGSPVKMEDLKLRESASLLTLKNFDPRPVDLRNRKHYSDHFRNVWLNSSAANCPIRQLYAPANLYAVANDHDYLEISPEEKFLDYINVGSIDTETCLKIQKDTLKQSSSKRWYEERQLRLQASNFGRICKRTDRTDSEELAKS